VENGSVRGFVFAPDGRGMAGVSVRANDVELTSDHEGAFGLEPPPREYAPIVRAPGYPDLVPSRVPVPSRQPSEPMSNFHVAGEPGVEIEAPQSARTTQSAEDANAPTAVVAGRVFSREKNVPVEGARIFVRGASADARSAADGTFQLTLPIGSRELTVI